MPERLEPVRGVLVARWVVRLNSRARALGLVHGHIGASQQVAEVAPVAWRDGHPDAGADVEGDAQGAEVAQGESAEDALGAHQRTGDVQRPADQDGELVPAQPGHQGVVTGGCDQLTGYLDQDLVAR